MILLIDNYDSFTYNLYQMIGIYDHEIKIIRNDELSVDEIRMLNPDYIVISPGPGNPEKVSDFGVCKQVIKELGSEIPILGICLGHQGVFNAFGGNIIRNKPVHGKKSLVEHRQDELFQGVENPLTVIRYHSLVCQEDSLPECLEVTARTPEGLIMAIRHREMPIFGLQFHPESVGTRDGSRIIGNFLGMEL